MFGCLGFGGVLFCSFIFLTWLSDGVGKELVV